MVDRARFTDLLEMSEEAHRAQKQRRLATLPAELARFDLGNFCDRPVQADLMGLLLLQKADRRFTSCVLVHGMGGTGKTVTTVAVLQEQSVREWFSDFYWLTVGADALGERVKQLQSMLYKQLTGKGIKAAEKEQQEWQQMLVTAMAEKQRALVVLDDPWLPEQVRFLSPVGSTAESEHRLLVTTRIRDLVPKATRVELPLMGKDEAVSLLLDLANVDEASYLKGHAGSAWPPPAAYEIAAEGGLLPVTLTIAAQVVRSWGDGWGE